MKIKGRYFQCGFNFLKIFGVVHTVISHAVRCHKTPHRLHRPQIQVLGIGKMCLVWCILLILIKKRNRLWFSCISACIVLLLLLIQCKISLYLGLVQTVRPVWLVRCFVTPHAVRISSVWPINFHYSSQAGANKLQACNSGVYDCSL